MPLLGRDIEMETEDIRRIENHIIQELKNLFAIIKRVMSERLENTRKLRELTEGRTLDWPQNRITESCSLSLYEVDSRPHNCVCLFFYSNPSKKRGRMKEWTREKEGRKRGRGKEGRMVLKISVWCWKKSLLKLLQAEWITIANNVP